ncbi:hypothetical protein C8R44DRAFT_764571 [Mycena epipterygia]|nr:hypothetical protein C8R44DRAFT_764571 [Mycena epipterygia]
MSTPGSSRNKKYESGPRKQSGDTVTFNLDTNKWSSEDRARAAEYQASFRPLSPGDYNLGAAPTGPLDVRMGRFPPAPSPRPHTPSRHHKSDSHSAAPGPYNGSAAVQRTPTHTTSQRINDFPQELGGRSRGYPDAAPKPSRPKDYPQPGYQTAPYPSSMTPVPGVPRSPDGVTGHRITMAMGQRPPPSGKATLHLLTFVFNVVIFAGGPQQAPHPNYADPRYHPSNGRGY